MTRPCGLYRTTRAVEVTPRTVEPPALVFLHDHAPDLPEVRLPVRNEHNRWHFAATGHAVDDDFVTSLVRLRTEGLYRLREHVHLADERVAAASSLVQLGYTARAEPLIFFPQVASDRNAIAFPERGTRIPPAVYELLEPLDIRGPRRHQPLH